jgi:hypothetical protein
MVVGLVVYMDLHTGAGPARVFVESGLEVTGAQPAADQLLRGRASHLSEQSRARLLLRPCWLAWTCCIETIGTAPLPG